MSALLEALKRSASGNSHTASPAAAVLWPDKERLWEPVIDRLRLAAPNLFSLGDYVPEQRRGPAIWLKCAIAGVLPEFAFQGVPVIYLPGVSRADLRAIESCPRDLQPLAELQYRGAIWSQANAKDWTVNAFLSSKNGGLGLDVAQDAATQEALRQTLQAGVLLEQSVDALQGRTLDAEWLRELVQPNHLRALLMWMNDPRAMRALWEDVRWDVFRKRCIDDFGFDPVADGVLVAAEHLAKALGAQDSLKWSGVAELYRDSHTSFPSVFELLCKVQPPQTDLFPELDKLKGYPQANEQGEIALRQTLSGCGEMDSQEARAAVEAAEKEHGIRRAWLWNRMGLSPLVSALEHLVEVARRSASLPVGATPDELATSYRHSGWLVDAAAMRALGVVRTKADLEAVGRALRALYLPWLEESARRLQEAAKSAGGLQAFPTGEGFAEIGAGTCTLFVDGLRYDVAVRLQGRLESLGEASLSGRWTSLPSVTASGKPWCSPVAKLLAGTADDLEFLPRIAADGKPLSGYNFRKLLSEHDIQPLAKHETGDPGGRAWSESGDLDHFGHEHGLRLARDLDAQLDQVVERVSELAEAGWKKIRVVTDHGWLLMPGGLPKTELGKSQAETRWGRCAVLKENAHGTPLTFGWDWCKRVQVAYAPGVSCFLAGAEYAHGGISLQECLAPVLNLDVSSAAGETAAIAIESVTWKGLRCSIVIDSNISGLRADIRTKAAQASTSLVANVKPFVGGKANLAAADDEHLGSAAVVVVLDGNGDVVQRRPTTVGE